MGTTRTLVCASLLLGGLMALVGCHSSPAQRSAGETIDDGVLTGRVKAALVADSRTKARQIDVEAYRGEVQLNGFVDSTAAKTAATSVTRAVPGVMSVKNNLKVGNDRTVGAVVDDAAITTQVKAALMTDTRTKAHQIEVATHDGVVQLGGFVDSATSKMAASEVVNRVKGVKSVDNGLDVRN